MAPIGRRAGGAALAGVLLALGVAAPASAHMVGGVQPSNYRSQIIEVNPPLPGVQVTLYDLGRRVRLTNDSGAELTVLGYSGEPYLRVGPAGVQQNLRSPTLYENKVAPGGLPVTPPPTASATAAPVWQVVSLSTTASWPDRRTYWSGPSPDGVAHTPKLEQIVVPTWIIPIRQGNVVAHVVGRIVWVPGPPLWPWLVLAATLAGMAVAAARTVRWGLLLSGCVALLVAFDAVHTWGIAVAPGGGWVNEAGRLFVSGSLSIAGWVIGALAISPLQREREGGLLAAAIAGASIGIFGGLGDVSSLTLSQLPVAVPAAAARLAVATSLGLGFGLVAAAVIRLRTIPPVPAPAVEVGAGAEGDSP